MKAVGAVQLSVTFLNFIRFNAAAGINEMISNFNSGPAKDNSVAGEADISPQLNSVRFSKLNLNPYLKPRIISLVNHDVID